MFEYGNEYIKTPPKATFDHLPNSSCIGTSLIICIAENCKLLHFARLCVFCSSKYDCD